MLLVVPWLRLGGADKFNLDLTEQLLACGWQVAVATTLPGPHPWLAKFLELTSDVHDVSERPVQTRLLELIQALKPEVVLVSNSEAGYSALPLLRFHAPTTAYIDFCHAVDPTWGGGGYARIALSRSFTSI